MMASSSLALDGFQTLLPYDDVCRMDECLDMLEFRTALETIMQSFASVLSKDVIGLILPFDDRWEFLIHYSKANKIIHANPFYFVVGYLRINWCLSLYIYNLRQHTYISVRLDADSFSRTPVVFLQPAHGNPHKHVLVVYTDKIYLIDPKHGVVDNYSFRAVDPMVRRVRSPDGDLQLFLYEQNARSVRLRFISDPTLKIQVVWQDLKSRSLVDLGVVDPYHKQLNLQSRQSLWIQNRLIMLEDECTIVKGIGPWEPLVHWSWSNNGYRGCTNQCGDHDLIMPTDLGSKFRFSPGSESRQLWLQQIDSDHFAFPCVLVRAFSPTEQSPDCLEIRQVRHNDDGARIVFSATHQHKPRMETSVFQKFQELIHQMLEFQGLQQTQKQVWIQSLTPLLSETLAREICDYDYCLMTSFTQWYRPVRNGVKPYFAKDMIKIPYNTPVAEHVVSRQFVMAHPPGKLEFFHCALGSLGSNPTTWHRAINSIRLEFDPTQHQIHSLWFQDASTVIVGVGYSHCVQKLHALVAINVLTGQTLGCRTFSSSQDHVLGSVFVCSSETQDAIVAGVPPNYKCTGSFPQYPQIQSLERARFNCHARCFETLWSMNSQPGITRVLSFVNGGHHMVVLETTDGKARWGTTFGDRFLIGHGPLQTVLTVDCLRNQNPILSYSVLPPMKPGQELVLAYCRRKPIKGSAVREPITLVKYDAGSSTQTHGRLEWKPFPVSRSQQAQHWFPEYNFSIDGEQQSN